MRSIIGFIPKQNTNELHLRVKNLTGDVIEITNNTVVANFATIEKIDNKKVEIILTVIFPINECEPYFVSQNHIKRHGINFHQFCMELKGYEIYDKNNEVPKWELFWGNISIYDIFGKNSSYTIKDRPVNLITT